MLCCWVPSWPMCFPWETYHGARKKPRYDCCWYATRRTIFLSWVIGPCFSRRMRSGWFGVSFWWQWITWSASAVSSTSQFQIHRIGRVAVDLCSCFAELVAHKIRYEEIIFYFIKIWTPPSVYDFSTASWILVFQYEFNNIDFNELEKHIQ